MITELINCSMKQGKLVKKMKRNKRINRKRSRKISSFDFKN